MIYRETARDIWPSPAPVRGQHRGLAPRSTGRQSDMPDGFHRSKARRRSSCGRQVAISKLNSTGLYADKWLRALDLNQRLTDGGHESRGGLTVASFSPSRDGVIP